MKKNLFSIGKKQVRVPIVQGGMGVGISLGGLPEQLQKKVESEQSLPHRLVLKNQIFMRIP